METDQSRPQPEPPRADHLEIAHVLFTDIVGYSRLPMGQQTGVLRRLQQVVSGIREFQEAQGSNRLITLPTGDGMALVFFGSPEEPRAVRRRDQLRPHQRPRFEAQDGRT